MKKILPAAAAVMIIAAGCTEKVPDMPNTNTVTEGTQAQSSEVQEVTVWVPADVRDFTAQKLDSWLTSSEWAGRYTVKTESMSEEDAASALLSDKDKGADIYFFRLDRLAGLAEAGALCPPPDEYRQNIEGDTGALAAEYDGRIYAYPATAEDGFFLYYDKSVVSDPSTLERVLADCAAADRYLYMDIQSAWYDSAFFLAAGSVCRYDYDASGRVTGVVCDHSEKGLAAMRALTDMHSSAGFMQSTGADAALFDPDGGTAGAIISGTWDADTVSGLLGSNCGTAKLPTFTAGGKTYQMSGTGGFRAVGVKPQEDAEKERFCHAAADFITGEEMQTARLDEFGWIPSDRNALQSDRIQSDPALAAMTEQLSYCYAQGRTPDSYRDIMADFGRDINSGKYDGAADDELLAALAALEKDIKDAG